MKILLSLVAIPILVLLASQAFGQVPSAQGPHEIIKVTIDETGTAHVIHDVNSTFAKSQPIQIDLVNGSMANLTVTDANDSAVEYTTIQKAPLSIILSPSERNMTLIKYDLVNAVKNTDGVWKWNYYEPQDTAFTAFYFPSGVDMIWANDRPVYLGNRGLGQHGNGFALEYSINEPVTIQNVQAAGKSFAVGVRTTVGVGNYVFDQAANTYSFDVDKAAPVTVIMPQDLLAGPYTVTLNGNATLHQEFHNNATHAWIGFKVAKSGTVRIVGTTPGQTLQTGPPDNSATITSGNAQSGSTDTATYLAIGGLIAAGVAGLVIMKKSRSKKAPSPSA